MTGCLHKHCKITNTFPVVKRKETGLRVFPPTTSFLLQIPAEWIRKIRSYMYRSQPWIWQEKTENDSCIFSCWIFGNQEMKLRIKTNIKLNQKLQMFAKQGKQVYLNKYVISIIKYDPICYLTFIKMHCYYYLGFYGISIIRIAH